MLSGVMVGLAGLSGGGPIISGLMLLGLPIIECIGTSIYILTGNSLVAFFLHLGIGSVDWQLLLLLLIGTVSGACVGPLLLKKLNQDKLEKC